MWPTSSDELSATPLTRVQFVDALVLPSTA